MRRILILTISKSIVVYCLTSTLIKSHILHKTNEWDKKNVSRKGAKLVSSNKVIGEWILFKGSLDELYLDFRFKDSTPIKLKNHKWYNLWPKNNKGKIYYPWKIIFC